MTDTVSNVNGGALERIGSTARSIEIGLRWAAEEHEVDAEHWRRREYAIGLPSAIVTALLGVGFLADPQEEWVRVLAAALAFVASALSASFAFLQPPRQVAAHSRAAISLRNLATRFEIFQSITCSLDIPVSDLKDELETLVQARDKAVEEAPLQSTRAISKVHAKKAAGGSIRGTEQPD